MAKGGSLLSDLPKILNFDSSSDISSLGIRWTRWLRLFELYATGQGVRNNEQKKTILLHSTGLSVQDTFYTMTIDDPGEGESLCTVLNTIKQSLPAKSKQDLWTFCFLSYEPISVRNCRSIYYMSQTVYCDFANTDEMIGDQVIEKCVSHRLRRMLLELPNVTLQHLREMALSLVNSER